MSFDIDKYFDKLTGGDVLIAHKGTITSKSINDILVEIEKKLIDTGVSNRIRKKIYNVLVESLQNLYHHLDSVPNELIHSEQDENFGLLVVAKKDNQYDIITGNFIHNSKIKKLQDKIDKVNTLSKEELKDLYKFILNHQKLSEKGGGGLGLVDIARKSDNKINYEFTDVNSDYSFFNLKVKIN